MKHLLLALATSACLMFGSTAAFSQSSPDGYLMVEPPTQTRNAEKVEVLEFFWFGCPHCFAFEPSINTWADSRPDYVDFVREAPPLNPAWLPHSQAFYAAEIMGVTDQMFDQFFNAIHVDRRTMRKPADIAAFMGELGIDEKKFLATMKSFAVETRIKQSIVLARAAGITGVPSVLINGKYLTGNSVAGGHEQIIDVIRKTSEQEHLM